MKTLDILKLYDNNNSNLIIKYLDYIKLYKTNATIDTYASNLKNFYDYIFKYYNTISYSIVNRKTLEDYIAYQVGKNLGSDIIHCRVMTIKNYFKYLVKNKMVRTDMFFDIFYELKTPKIVVKNQLLIKADETINITKKIYNCEEKSSGMSFANERNIFMLLLMSNTGIRRKEVACIDIKNINLSNNTITIYKTKGDKPRIVSFSDSLKIKLIEYLKLRKDIIKKRCKKDHNILLIKSNGDELNINTISTMMYTISKKTNIKVTCHSLRRGFATDMAENGTDIYVISKMLGHQNINTTVSRYIYVLAGMIKEAMENHPFSKIKYSENGNKKIKDNIIKDDVMNILTNLSSQIYEISVRLKA
ncbi:tyrosine-type recombinase/integrase [Brachyspira pilosicoli]|uniref:tyrosine-type recombinase/integrase n=1 Tax=Brachyspira pilosicoli TaxID=52584 RepID=UPI002664E6C0|nr:site-specific integrase [Brachyspira pilosicoli]